MIAPLAASVTPFAATVYRRKRLDLLGILQGFKPPPS